MKRDGILNDRLMAAIASMGHGDVLMVVDAGFPIPREAARIDVSLAPDIPDLRLVLGLIHREMIVERVVLAAEMAAHNAPLRSWLAGEFTDAQLDERPHDEMLSVVPRAAKAIVRTGAFDPWGNIGLVSGVDVRRWFARDGVVVPDYYRDRFATMSVPADTRRGQ
jgi:D-ribose pyranose/furanose isomerase RbsD